MESVRYRVKCESMKEVFSAMVILKQVGHTAKQEKSGLLFPFIISKNQTGENWKTISFDSFYYNTLGYFNDLIDRREFMPVQRSVKQPTSAQVYPNEFHGD